MKRSIIVVALVALGIGRLWLERDLTADLRKAELLPPKLDLSVRDEMSQESLIAVLGGMRALIAGFYEIEAFSAFSLKPSNWHKVDQYYALCTKLQPKDERYWDSHSWMLHANLSEDYASEKLATPGLEEEMRAYYRQKGLSILMKGLEFNPDSFLLNTSAARFFCHPHPKVNPRPDYAQAAEYYLRASKSPKAKEYVKSFHALYLSMAPGKEREGYELLRQRYNLGPNERYPTAIRRLKELEEKLNIPYPMRIPEAYPGRPKHSASQGFMLGAGNVELKR